jgi:hypothetical protein
LRQHADHVRPHPVQHHRLAENLRIAAEAPLPHAVADERHRGHLIDPVLVVGERAADDRGDAERTEQRRRDGLAEDAFGGGAIVFEAERPHAAGDPVECTDRFEGLRLIPEGDIAGNAGGAELIGFAAVGNRPDDDEPIGSRERERLQQRRIHQAEDHAVGGDAERQRRGRGEGEAGIAAQAAQAVEQIARERLDPEKGIGFAGALLDTRAIAEPAERRGPGLPGRQPAIDVRLDLQCEVRLDLFVELAVGPPLQPPSKAHDTCPCVFRTRPTARTIFSHLLVSATSLARPVRVSV